MTKGIKGFQKGHKTWCKGTKGLMKPNSGSFKKEQIPYNKPKLSDGSFYPCIPSICQCLNHCNKITYNGNKFVSGHNNRPHGIYHETKLLDGSWYPFIPTICICGCNEIIFYSKKLSNFKLGHYARVNHPRNRKGSVTSESTKEKLRISSSGKRNGMYNTKPSYKCNRSHGDWYKTPQQGIKFLRSQWEIKYAKYLDLNNILWYYEFKGFLMNIGKDSLYFPNGKDSTYHPDFFLPKENKFIEIKGRNNYEQWNEDDAKLKSDKFREDFCKDYNYEVLFRDDLLKLGINLKSKEPKFIFENKEEEEKYIKKL